MPLACGVGKGRARSNHLKCSLRTAGAIQIALGCRVFCRWVPTEWNVADAPSRLRARWCRQPGHPEPLAAQVNAGPRPPGCLNVAPPPGLDHGDSHSAARSAVGSPSSGPRRGGPPAKPNASGAAHIDRGRVVPGEPLRLERNSHGLLQAVLRVPRGAGEWATTWRGFRFFAGRRRAAWNLALGSRRRKELSSWSTRRTSRSCC